MKLDPFPLPSRGVRETRVFVKHESRVPSCRGVRWASPDHDRGRWVSWSSLLPILETRMATEAASKSADFTTKQSVFCAIEGFFTGCHELRMV